MNKFIKSLLGLIAAAAAIAATAQNPTPYDMPDRIKRGEGASAVYLDKVQTGSWRECTSQEPGGQDSTCVVPYRYGVAASVATITGGFTKDNPFVGGTGTSPHWTTTNAVSLTVNCTGVGTYSDGNAPLQSNPSGILFNSPVAGVVTCVLRALNSDNEPTTLTIKSTFVMPVAPTIQAGFVRPNFDAGTGGSQIYWASQNAKSVYVTCTGFNWGPGYIGLQGNPSGVTMDISYTGTINCTFKATNEVGQTATATATASVTRPLPPRVNGAYSPANITAGQQSQLLYNSANATVLGIVCNGLKFAAVQSPSMLLNQPWYWFNETWPDAGTQSCNIHAHNSMGEVAVVTFDLVVAPAGFSPSGGGSSGEASYPPGDPRNPPATGSNASSGRPQGYTDPATGVTYSDPGGTQVCGSCNTSAGMQTNPPPSAPTPTDTGTGSDNGGGTTTTSSSP